MRSVCVSVLRTVHTTFGFEYWFVASPNVLGFSSFSIFFHFDFTINIEWICPLENYQLENHKIGGTTKKQKKFPFHYNILIDFNEKSIIKWKEKKWKKTIEAQRLASLMYCFE